MEVVGSILLSIVQSILFYGKELGISIILFLILTNGILYYILYKKNKIYNKKGFFLLIPILLLGSTYFIFANRVFYTMNLFVLALLHILMYAIVTNNFIHIGNIALDTAIDLEDAITITKEKTNKVIGKQKIVEKERMKKVAISLLFVFAIVGIILILLASADSIFASLFSGVRIFFRNMNMTTIWSLMLRIIIIAVVYLFFLNYTLKLQKEYNQKEKKTKNVKNEYEFTIKLLLIALNIIYLVFCFIQIESLFAKINMQETFNYANYARTGFFQLMFVSIINFAIILVSNRYDKKLIKILNLLLVIFTVVIAISSMYRMYMYEMEYGLTYLRMLVYIILITEIACFIPILISLFNKKLHFIKACFVIVLCVYCGINYMNLENMIIKKNMDRQISSVPVDYEYIASIASEDSFNILEEKLQEENRTTKEKLEIVDILLRLANNSKNLSLQEWNIAKAKMKNVDIKNLQEQRNTLEEFYDEERKIEETITTKSRTYLYHEMINENEEYFVEQIDSVMGTAVWKIEKATNNKKDYQIVNERLVVSTPSKIKFFENGLGFLERPTSIYCEKSELLVTHDSGKTFETIQFPNR